MYHVNLGICRQQFLVFYIIVVMNVNQTLLFDPQVAIVDIMLIKYAECGTFHGNIDLGTMSLRIFP